jgi:flagellar hook-associated protein 1 FlgK
VTSTFFGLETALRGLRAQQTALDVTNHNVANANTPGYSRQMAELATTPPYTLPGFTRPVGAGQIGTGVTVASIQRARDTFLDIRYRTEYSGQQQAQVAQDALDNVQAVLNDPSSTGLSSQFATFFNSWQDLANDPSDSGTRILVVRNAESLAAAFNGTARQLTAEQQSLNEQVNSQVQQLNGDLTQIADLNRQIVQAEFGGLQANDLRDRRDALIDHVAGMAQITTVENPNGMVDVMLGSRALVQGTNVDSLTTTATGPGGMWEVRFASDNALATLNAGSLRGLIDARDVNIPGYLTRLNQVAGDLITAVNGLHTTGYGQDNVNGRPFFAGTDAATIAVDPTIAGNPSLVGVADAPNQPGNNAVALAIAQLRHTMSPTTEASYGALVAALGGDAQAAHAQTDHQAAVVGLIDRQRQAVSGVSLDEEAVNTVRYQRAYEAAARVITTVDEMLDKLINSTGIVGR